MCQAGKSFNHDDYLNSGNHAYFISGFLQGMYMLSVSSPSHNYRSKIFFKKAAGSSPEVTYLQSNNLADEAPRLKSVESEVEMDYNHNDLLKFTFYSGIYKTVITDRCKESKTITALFLQCSDLDKRDYAIVQIDSQIWMAENLAYLPSVSKPDLGSFTDPFYYVYDFKGSDVANAKNTESFKRYGVLYNWPAAMKACPDGWHLPSDEEWNALENNLANQGHNYDGTFGGGRSKIAKAMASQHFWKTSLNKGSVGNDLTKNNSSGFSGLPGGNRYEEHEFNDIGKNGYWWSSTTNEFNSAWSRGLNYENPDFIRNSYYYDMDFGMSVRCISDLIQKYNLPTVKTAEITSITDTSAASGGTVISDGGLPITARGVCWNNTGNPTIADTHTNNGTGTGTWVSELARLDPLLTYYVRAYATNSEGTGYGQQVTFTLCGTTNLNDGLVGYWPFNGNANDESGNGNHGTVKDAILTTDRFGNEGKAYSFDGVNDYISLGKDGEIHNGQIFSVSLWFNSNEVIEKSLIGTFPIPTSSTNGWRLNIRSGNTIWYEIGVWGSALGPKGGSYTTNAWYHLVGIKDGTSFKLCQNNQLISEETVDINFDPELELNIGLSGNSGLEYFNGSIDDIRIYNRALTDCEIASLYDADMQLPTVSTSEITNITHNTATSGGNITSDGGASITARSICWNTSGNPTISDTHSNDSTGIGTSSWVSELAELEPTTTYYVRAYATNGVGTSYGEELIFRTNCENIIDTLTRDTVTIVVDVYSPATGRTWMDRNLGASRAALSRSDEEAFGDLYQWGRATDGHQKRNSPLATTLSSTHKPNHGNFISAEAGHIDWRSTQKVCLWQGVDGTNNPCPSGYRIPTYSELDAELKNRGSSLHDGMFDTPLKMPMAGTRFHDYGPHNGGLDGYYWSSTLNGDNAAYLYFSNSSDANISYWICIQGNSVRCIKDESTQASLPSVTTSEITNITHNTATSGGNITSDSGAPITARGVCWNTSGNPTIANSHANNGTGTGSWVSELAELKPVTTYYVRAYATNKKGTAYGEVLTFTTECPPPTTDWPRDTQTVVVEVINPVTGKTWMDRNLGASRAATSLGDTVALGDLYQWGRAADGHQKRNSPTTTTLSTSDIPGHGNFIIAPNQPGDWRSPQNTCLWQGVNGMNNPCPMGYRLPTGAELEAERQSWSINNASGALASPLKLPMARRRLSSSGSLDYGGSDGFYWSSTVGSIISQRLYFQYSDAYTDYDFRAFGGSVRCIKD